MAKWEYTVWVVSSAMSGGNPQIARIDGKSLGRSSRDLYEALQEAGANGWVLFGSSSDYSLFFKRPLPEG